MVCKTITSKYAILRQIKWPFPTYTSCTLTCCLSLVQLVYMWMMKLFIFKRETQIYHPFFSFSFHSFLKVHEGDAGRGNPCTCDNHMYSVLFEQAHTSKKIKQVYYTRWQQLTVMGEAKLGRATFSFRSITIPSCNVINQHLNSNSYHLRAYSPLEGRRKESVYQT